MKQRPRIYYTETDKSLMWDRWQKGDAHCQEITVVRAAAFDPKKAFVIGHVHHQLPKLIACLGITVS